MLKIDKHAKISQNVPTKYGFTLILVSIFIFSQFFVSDAYAYIDPASMSVVFALILGVLVGTGMTIKLYWIKLKNKLSRILIDLLQKYTNFHSKAI